MSQQITRSVNDSTGKSKRTAQSYHPVWMAHWMQTSSNVNTSAERRNLSARPKEEVEPVKEPVIQTKTLGECLRTSPKSLGNTKELRPMVGINFPSKIIPAANEFSLRGFPSPGEGGTSNNPHEYNLKKYELDKGKAVVYRPLIDKPDLRMLEQEHRHKQSQPESDTSINTCFRDFNTSLLFGCDWFQKMQQFPSVASEEDETKNKSRFDFYNLKKLSNNSVLDLEKTRNICTAVDSVQATPGGCPRFSQTTHSVFITKKTDANLSQENDVFRATRLVKKTNEKTFFGQGNRGVKLQPLSSEGRNNVRNVEGRKVTIKNESSAETDTMEMDFFKEEKLNSGANSTPSTKAFNIDSNSSPPIVVAASRETERQWTKVGLPDINLELPALPAVGSSPENLCPSFSRTQSLKMDMLLANAEQTKTKSNINMDALDPPHRWVKHLKMGSSKSNSSSRGTKISNPTKNLSHDKMRKYFRSILYSGIASSEPSPSLRNTNLSDKNGELSKVGEEFTLDTGKKAKELLLSHAWITRWLRNGSRVIENKPDQTVGKVCESRYLKISLDDDDLEKKQFPSIGARALMGKAMSDFQSCEIQKRGSITVWNTKALY